MNNLNNSPLVTVVIPTHNRPEFLKRTLDSICSQTYRCLQIIVVSNGPNQKNKEAVDSLNDNRIEYYQQPNSGTPASPRNTGISHAKGEYVAFCDDDDIWMPDKVEKQVNVLNTHMDYDVCYTKMIRFDDIKEWTMPHEEGYADFHSLLYFNNIPLSSVMVRMNFILREGSFSLSQKVGTSPDYELLLRFSLRTKLYYLDEYLVKYWSGNNRITRMDGGSRSIKLALKHLLIILNTYLMTYKNSSTSVADYIRPSLFNIKNFIKTVLVIIKERIQHSQYFSMAD
jgi:glycosyltransferase domain-containing protein